jgi:small subunit ribosomal protein S6
VPLVRPYEVVIIFDATLDETVIRETTDAVVEFVRSRGGSPGHVDRWGRRPFAYELKHRTEGYYVFIEVNGEPALLAEVDRMLSLSDDVLRHRVLRRPEGRQPAAAAAAAEPKGATAE